MIRKPFNIDAAGNNYLIKNGRKYYFYYENDKVIYHRLDGPAVEYDGDKEYWVYGKMHRENGPALERADGTKMWYMNGKLHRIGDPAIEYGDGSKEWWINHKRHRIDGPAIERTYGTKMWFIEDKYIDCKSQQEFERLLKLRIFW